jgi:hypothetical protein
MTDCEGTQVVIEAGVTGPIQRGRHTIVDESCSMNPVDGERLQRTAGLGANRVVFSAADGKVALLECAGERQASPQFSSVHPTSTACQQDCPSRLKRTRARIAPGPLSDPSVRLQPDRR